MAKNYNEIETRYIVIPCAFQMTNCVFCMFQTRVDVFLYHHDELETAYWGAFLQVHIAGSNDSKLWFIESVAGSLHIHHRSISSTPPGASALD